MCSRSMCCPIARQVHSSLFSTICAACSLIDRQVSLKSMGTAEYDNFLYVVLGASRSRHFKLKQPQHHILLLSNSSFFFLHVSPFFFFHMQLDVLTRFVDHCFSFPLYVCQCNFSCCFQFIFCWPFCLSLPLRFHLSLCLSVSLCHAHAHTVAGSISGILLAQYGKECPVIKWTEDNTGLAPKLSEQVCENRNLLHL